MDPLEYALRVKAARVEIKMNLSAQRRSDNIQDRGTPVAILRERGRVLASRVHRDFTRTWDRMANHTRRGLRRGGVNRHRAAIRGAGGLNYAMSGPHARQTRYGEKMDLSAQRMSVNVTDRGPFALASQRARGLRSPSGRAEINRSGTRRFNSLRRRMLGQGMNRHRAAIRGENGAAYTMRREGSW